MTPIGVTRYNNGRITGNIRFRIHKRWFRDPILVPQREIEYDMINAQDFGNPDPIIQFVDRDWYDMRVDDVLSMRQFHVYYKGEKDA
jgi:hypothetical protein